MAELAAKRERELVKSTNSNPRLLVPGSVEIAADGLMSWTERCRARCKHDGAVCHASRSALLPYVSYAERMRSAAGAPTTDRPISDPTDEFFTGCTEDCPDDCTADHQGEQ